MSSTNPSPVSTTVLMACVTTAFCFVVAACVAVFLAVPEGANTFSLVAILVGSLAPTIASLVGLVKLSSVQTQVIDVAADTEKLTNGFGDAKLRRAVADVLHPDLIDPAVRAQLSRDETSRVTPQ